MAAFTKLEIEIINHRLVMTDCLDDALAGDEPVMTSDELATAAESLEKRIAEDRWNGLSQAEREVLAECVNGSTWMGCAWGEYESMDDKKAAKAFIRKQQRAMDSAADKIAKMTGLQVVAPDA